MTTQTAYASPPIPEEPPFDPWDGYPATAKAKPAPHANTTTATANTTDDKPRYKIHLASEALEPQPPILWTVEEVFSAGSVNLLTGEPGDGKTSACLDCGVAVALGERWLGYAVTQGAVLIVDEESGPQRLKRRLGDVMRGHDADASLDLYFITLARFNLWDARDVGALQCAIEDCGARFVIVDALADVMPGRDENAVKDVQPVFMALRAIAETTNAAIVVIHHNNKTGGYRGSSAIKGAVDLLLTVSKAGNVLTFTADKARDVDRESVKFAARCNWGEGIFNLSPAPIESGPAQFTKGQRYVLRYLANHDASDFQEIQDNADVCSSGTAKNAVYQLTERGLCKRVDEGGKGARAMYALTSEGEEVAQNL